MLWEPCFSAKILCLLPRNTSRPSLQQQWLLKALLFLVVSLTESNEGFKEHCPLLWSKHSQTFLAQQVHTLCEQKTLKLEQRADHLSLAVSYSNLCPPDVLVYRFDFGLFVLAMSHLQLHFFHLKAPKSCTSLYLTASLTRVQSLICCTTAPLIMRVF